ncbi:40S ribosomal protein S13 [Astathelohania contejeani]|uniref:40S ribosomal protein S13 n=1 Tax=Astathelohania contejeani TaxID=164912 RepID=A0ABQ7HY85_9MICR|nr:40S ribosomal protein S13 [Thelohania contejeani]
MGRIYGHGKGKSRSVVPYNQVRSSWVTKSDDEIVNEILNLARKGYTPNKIGNILRDEHGIGKVSHFLKDRILNILRKNGCAPSIPEDVDAVYKKCINMREHIAMFRNDKGARYQLMLAESKLHRLIRYHKKNNTLCPTWKPKFTKSIK